MNDPIPAAVTMPADHGKTNRRLLARKRKDPFKKVESSSRKVPITLYSPEGKRLYLRCFDIAQANFHFIAVIARIRLPVKEIEQIETQILDMLDERIQNLNQTLVDTEARCQANGITGLASYDVDPLWIEAKLFSKFGRRLLEMILKVDQLMPMLETLCIDGAISSGALTIEKSRIKRLVRSATGTSRAIRASMERRMNIEQPQPVSKVQKAPSGGSPRPIKVAAQP